MLFALIAVAVLAVMAFLVWRSPAADRSPQASDGATRPRPRPVAPDDDPEFLRRLDEMRRHQREDPPSA